MNYCISMWKLPKMNVSTELKHSGGREEAYVNYVDYVEHTSLVLASCWALAVDSCGKCGQHFLVEALNS